MAQIPKPMLRYSRGANIHDNRPQARAARDFATFVEMLDADRAPDKATAAYFAGPFNGEGRRCAEGALPRRWLALDLDRIDADSLPEFRLWLARFSGCAWPTHSSKPDAPRERAILELDRAASRDECIAVGAELSAELTARFGDALKLDPSTYRPEQPNFVPPTGVTLARFDGEPLNVDAYLGAQKARAKPSEPPQSGDPAEDDLLDQIERGKSLHDALRTLVGRMAAKGLDAKLIRAAALGLLERVRKVRGDRVDELAGAELDRLIAGALAKFAPQPTELPRLLDLGSMAGDPPAPAFVIDDWLPQGEVTLFGGHGGTGKSAIALYLAVCVALGKPVFGIPTQPRRVLLLSLEDTEPVLHWRLSRVSKWIGFDATALAGKLTIADGTGADAELFAETKQGANLTHVYEWLRQRMADAEELIIDGASDAFGASEINRRLVRQFVRAVRRLIPANGAAVLLAHVDKAAARSGETSQGYSGSTAWNNSVRARWYLRPDEAGDGLILEVQKANNARAGAQIAARWNDEYHVFAGECVLPADRLERETADSDERAAVLELIRRCDAAGDPMPAATRGDRSAHAFAEARGLPQPLCGRRGRSRFYAHIETLRAAGAVRIESIRRPNRHLAEVLRASEKRASNGTSCAGNDAACAGKDTPCASNGT